MNQYKLHKKPLQMVCYILNWVQVLFRVNSTCHTSKAGYRHTDEYIAGTLDIWAGNRDVLQKSGQVATLTTSIFSTSESNNSYCNKKCSFIILFVISIMSTALQCDKNCTLRDLQRVT